MYDEKNTSNYLQLFFSFCFVSLLSIFISFFFFESALVLCKLFFKAFLNKIIMYVHACKTYTHLNWNLRNCCQSDPFQKWQKKSQENKQKKTGKLIEYFIDAFDRTSFIIFSFLSLLSASYFSLFVYVFLPRKTRFRIDIFHVNVTQSSRISMEMKCVWK